MAARITRQTDRLVQIAGIPGDWQTVSGGNPSYETKTVRPSAAAPQEHLPGRTVYDDLVVGRPYRAARDAAWVKPLLAENAVFESSATVQDLDYEGTPIPGARFTYGISMMSVTMPDGDASSDAEAMIEMAFSVRNIA